MKFKLTNKIVKVEVVDANSVEELKEKYPDAIIESIVEKPDLEGFFNLFLKTKEQLEIQRKRNEELHQQIFEKEKQKYSEIKEYFAKLIPMIKQTYSKQISFVINNHTDIFIIYSTSCNGKDYWKFSTVKTGRISDKNGDYSITDINECGDVWILSDYGYSDQNTNETIIVRHWEEMKIAIEEALMEKLNTTLKIQQEKVEKNRSFYEKLL